MIIDARDAPFVRRTLRELRKLADPEVQVWIEEVAASWGIALDDVRQEQLARERRAVNPHRMRRKVKV